MRNKYFIALIVGIFSTILSAQIPAGYYDGTAGLTGATLKSKLSTIITQGHRDNGYGGLWTSYKTTDVDKYYEGNGTILDIYSEKPTGPDAYEYTVSTNQCGGSTPTTEGGCYNREHIVPQSLFNSNAPMVSDIHFIRPTDSKVNGRRSNYPFGVVGSASFTSTNSSKLGNSVSAGYGGTVFEPINEFKGDVARMIFYFVTRYENKLSGFSSGDMLGGSAYPGLQKWELDVLLAWAAQDPVSQTEIDRNNASYVFQGNRNPYIDHPEYVAQVWGPTSVTPDTEAPSTPTNISVNNITNTTATATWTASTDNIAVAGYNVYLNGTSFGTTSTPSINLTGLTANTNYTIVVEAYDSAGNKSAQSLTSNFTTTNDTTPPPTPIGTSCGTENFTNIPKDSSAGVYLNDTWTSNNITWTATDSRTDQTINGAAITIRNGSLTSSTISSGIGSLTVTTQLKFTGTSSNLDVYINDIKVGTVPYSATATTTTINNINVSGNVVIKLVNPTKDNRIALDDLSWTCYSALGTNENKLNNKFSVYPNPVTNQELNITGLNITGLTNTDNSVAQIYSVTGQLLQTVKDVKNNSKISLKQLPKGIYLLKIGTQTAKFIVK